MSDIMSVEEAIKWLTPDNREFLLEELENTKGINALDIAVPKINEACEIACNIMRNYLKEIEDSKTMKDAIFVFEEDEYINIITQHIKIKYFDKELPKLELVGGSATSDWIDLRSAETVELKAGEFKLIHLGVGMKLPDGFEAHIVPRSSTFKKWGIIQTNHQAVIDNSYCGDEDEWLYPALAMRDTVINKGDRICQFRIMEKMPPIVFEEVEHLDEKSRKGFGSTGTN